MEIRKVANFKVDKEAWDKFVFYCKQNETSASAQLRLYVGKFFVDEVSNVKK